MLIFSSLVAAETMEDYYSVLEQPQPTETGSKIEVLEIFWYGCPHCYAFEPYLREWLENKPDNVEFRLMPGILNAGWVPHARAYYTAVEIGVLNKIHPRLFDAIHKDGRNIFNQQSIREFFIEQGIKEIEFDRTYNSPELDGKARAAYDYQRNCRITGVPSIIVNGKYVTSPSLAGSPENVLKVIDYLINKEMKGRDSQ